MSTLITAELNVFKTVVLGTGIKDAHGFRIAIKDAGMQVGDRAYDIMSKPAFAVAQEPLEVDLVGIYIYQLGFEKGAELKDIFDEAMKRGLELCPNEVGPQLRLQYVDQPLGEWLTVAMEPICDSYGQLEIFRVDHRSDYGRWIAGCVVTFMLPEVRLLFVKPRK